MKALFFALIITGCANAQTIATVKESGAGYLVTLSDGATLSVPKDPDNRHAALVQKWIAAGNIVAPADEKPPEVARAELIEQRITLQLRIIALERERDELKEATLDDAETIATMISEARERLAALRKK